MKELRIYQTSLELIKEVYTLIGSNQNLQRDFSLVDQLKRASVSVTANIAEGYQRTPKHNKYFLTISSGSTNEMVALLEVCITYLPDRY